jgi:hypothetical protein
VICALRPGEYAASQILTYLSHRIYPWFEPRQGGWLSSALLGRDTYNQDLIAVLEERIEPLENCIAPAQNERPET